MATLYLDLEGGNDGNAGTSFANRKKTFAGVSAIAAAGDTAYALLAGKAGTWLSRSRIRAIEIVSGACLTAGGVWMALRGR